MVSATTQLKLTAADGKKYNTDVISQDGVEKLAKSIRNQQAMDFLDWLIYSDNSIDGQSRKKAYHQKKYHFVQSCWGMLIGLIPCLVGAGLYAWLLC